ncbi:LytTR family DNA-binding domain-containing protein [Caulobacter sp.]|uniref:LytTR family DNA-binding domain-containing protein n=1 Tax=Caulobacter sp. TaxID=78 RepID=UPI002B497E70|nr:LytTR family DNA-binding domain-containing protein [Caulobacter sp.]HJV40751.1 LytTR family DNA-binding domain-containing protein [Caulobacter sp.]
MTGEERQWLVRAWLLGACLVAAIAVVNVLTLQHDAPELGVIAPTIWEASSALVTLFIFAIPAAMAFWMVRAHPRWWVVAPAHTLAVFVYSVLHVCGFVALRKLAHAALLHEAYTFGPLSTEFPYEFRKDMMSYGLATIIYWLALRRSAQKPDEPPALPATFDIQDGARLIRVPVAEILAVRSAGNYVEFLLTDSRRPLMRSSLSAVLEALAPRGFVRTHKSWLVNKARVTGLKPEGSGDYAVELGGLDVPLSRRFPEALKTLRR